MATTRIKDLSKTATTLAADSNFVIDGSTNGTQKITTGNVKADIATSFAGDLSTYGIATLGSDNKLNPDQLPDSVTNGINFVGTADSGSDLTSTTQGDFYIVNTAFTHLSISYAVGDSAVYNGSAYVKVTPGTTQIGEGGTGASTLDGAKANLEIPDVGTAPNEVPMNGMLGSMAFQSAEGISVGTLEADGKTTLTNDQDNALVVETTNKNPMYVNVVGSAPNYLFDVRDDDTSKFRVDGSGRVGINQTSPGSLIHVKDNSDATNDGGIQIERSTNSDKAFFNMRGGRVGLGSASSVPIRFYVGGNNKWTIGTGGDLVASASGVGIDFGATSDGSGSMSSEVLDDYEEGTWIPVFGVTSGSFTTMTMDVISARYVKVGNLVNFICYIRTSNVNTTGTGGQLIVSGLPYANAGSNSFAACSVGYAQDWANAPAAGYVVSGGSYIFLTKRVTGINGDLSEMVAGDMTTGAVPNENQLMISGIYSSF